MQIHTVVVFTSYVLCSERSVRSAAWIQQYEHIGFWVAEFVEVEDKNALRLGEKTRSEVGYPRHSRRDSDESDKTKERKTYNRTSKENNGGKGERK